MPILSSTFFVFKAAQGTVKTWFPVILSPLLSLTVSAHSFSPISFLPHHLRPPPIFYLSRGPAVTEHSARRLRQLFLKSNKRSWKKRQEFLCSDVRLFTWRDLLLSVQSPPPCPSRLQSTKSLSGYLLTSRTLLPSIFSSSTAQSSLKTWLLKYF